MSVDIFGRPTNSQGFASDTKLQSFTQGLKAEDKLMKIDIMNVRTNVKTNDNEIAELRDIIHDYLIRIRFLEQELENGLTKQKQNIIMDTANFMDNKTFDQLKVKSIAYISDHGTQITNWKSFQTKIDYIESGIRQLEDYINNTLTKMQLKYINLSDETEKTLHTINNHLKNIKEKHDNFKQDVKNQISNFIATLTLYDNKIRQLSDNIISLTESLDNKIKELKDETIKETIQILYDSGMFGLYENTDELLEKYLTFNNRRRTIIE